MKTNYVKHFLTAMLFAVLPVGFAFAEVPSREGEPSVSYKFISVDGQNIFYREAGDRTNPTVLLLHGFPTSSQMFRGLIPQLADKYHVIAPDYPGFGQISMPCVAEFEYSFDNLARILEKFTEQDGINKYSLCLQDYGAPIGFRIAEMNPNKVQALIIQNGNAYEEGLREFWIPFKAYWQDRSETNVNALRNFLTLEAKQWQWSHETRDQQIINPDNWTLDQAYLDRTGNQAIQLELFYSYGSNPPLYPQWKAYFRQYQPPTLIVWGMNDYIFPAEGVDSYKRDLRNLEFHSLNTGHFTLEEDGNHIAGLIRRFLAKQKIK